MEGTLQDQTLTSGAKRKTLDDFELAKQKALEVATRHINSATAADSKRPRFDSPDAAPASYAVNSYTAQTGEYNGFQGTSKKIHIPNGKVGMIIGRGGEMIKNLQHRSGAKIQITRDSEADPSVMTREVELTGTPEQVIQAEELINEVIAETDVAGSGGPSGPRAFNPGQPGAEQLVMLVPTDKVALIIGKGGETIKKMQSESGARIQVVPLHPPPGDTSTERSVYINGTPEQIGTAKELVNDVLSGNRLKIYSGSTGYTQAGYPPTGGWAPQGQPPVHQQQQQQQQPGYGYGQQGSYAMPPAYYAGYPPQQAGYDQSTPAAGYNMYGQQQAQPISAPPSNVSYGYGQGPPSSSYNYNQGYPQQAPPYAQDVSNQAPPTGLVNPPNPVYGGQPPASFHPDGAAATQTFHPGYGVPAGSTHPDASQSQPYPASYSQPTTTAPVNGYGTYPGYGALQSYNQAGYAQMGYGQQQQGTQAPPPASYPYYGQSGYPPQQVQTNYYQGAYPQAPGQPPVQGQATAAVSQPPIYGGEKADGGTSVAVSSTTATQTAES